MKQLLKILIIILFIVVLCAFGALYYFTPIMRPFPQPTGPYGVGITRMAFTDARRKETHAPELQRELVVDLFYPTQKTDSETTYPYQPQQIQAIIPVWANHSWMPEWVIKRLLSNLHSYAQPNAPVARGTYPLILFSHGIGGPAFYNVYLEDLASYGYVVAAIYHPYDTEVVAFPDGRVVALNAELRAMINKNDRARIYPYRAKAHELWLEDLYFLISELGHLNSDVNSPFYNSMDFTKLGAMGHSHGGAVMIELVRLNSRVKAGIDMDGWTKTANVTKEFYKPFMTLVPGDFDTSAPFTGGTEGWDEFLRNMQQNKHAWLVPIASADHGSFTDDGIQMKWPLGHTKKEADRVRAEIQQQIRNFFDRYLKREIVELAADH